MGQASYKIDDGKIWIVYPPFKWNMLFAYQTTSVMIKAAMRFCKNLNDRDMLIGKWGVDLQGRLQKPDNKEAR